MSAPAPLTDPTTGVDAFTTTRDPSGGVHVLWTAERAAGHGLHYLHAGGSTEAAPPGVSLGTEGLVPALAVDGQGLLHIAWSYEPDYGLREIRYATLDAASGVLSEVTSLATIPVPIGQVLRDPVVGLSREGVYVFWSVERRGGGLTPPAAESRYVYLPGGRVQEAIVPHEVVIPATREPGLVGAQSEYHVSWLASASTVEGNSQCVYFPSPADASGNELAVAFSAQLVGRTKAYQQVVLTLWSGGEMRGYQVAGQTSGSSVRPSLVTDGAKDLYVSWIGTAGFGAFDVFVAGTSDPMRAYLDRWRLRDVGVAALDGLWGLAQAAGFLPMTVAWFVPPLALLAIYAVIRPEGDLARHGPQIMLVIACALYLVFKVMFRPAWLVQFPVPRWVDAALADRMVLFAPLAIALLAVLVTWYWARHKDYPSLFPAFLIFSGCDALLTLLVYVPAVLSE